MLLGIYDEELEKQAIIEETEERVREEERERANIIIGKEREKAKQQALDTATELIKEGFQSEKILKYVKNLTLEDVINLQKKMNKE